MKKVLTTGSFLLICGLIFAQDHTEDESAINKQVDAMVYSWNHHNYDDLKNYTTENTDWVNVVGMWWKGRKESQYAHQVYHNTIFKTAVCEKTSVEVDLFRSRQTSATSKPFSTKVANKFVQQ